jgi:hypothetical protein
LVLLEELEILLRQDLEDYLDFILDGIYRINWIFSFGRSPEESAQTPIACGK